MPYSLPPGLAWTETLVGDALVAAWSESPRSVEAAAFMNLVPVLLASHPDERTALAFRSLSFARHDAAALNERLRAFGLSRSTYEDRWRRGLRIMTRELNELEQRPSCDNNNIPKSLDARKTCA